MTDDANAPGYREFALKNPGLRKANEPRRFVPGIAISAAIVIVALVVLTNNGTTVVRILALATIVLAGAAGIVSAFVVTSRSTVGVAEFLRVDGDGMIWHGTPKALAPFALGEIRCALPWSKVVDLTFVETRDLPFAAIVNSDALEYVGVVPVDIDAALRQLPKIVRSQWRSTYDHSGLLLAGPIEGVTAQELLDILTAYRNRTPRSGDAPEPTNM